MNPHKPFFQRIAGRKTMVALGAAISVLAVALPASGCGSSTSDSGTRTATAGEAGGLSRPAPGTVEMLDGRSDVVGSQEMSAAPSWVDAGWASVSKAGDNLVFSMDLAGALPAAMQAGMAAEWGFMIDSTSSGAPDRVVYASDSVQDGWTWGVYNPKTKQRLTGDQFPGAAEHADTRITLTVSAASMGAPQAFKWFAFSNVYVKSSTGGQAQQAGDKIPDKGEPDNSADWLPYP